MTNEVAVKIIAALQKADRPLIAYQISRKIKESPQLVDYHLKNLLQKQVVLQTEDSESKHYFLQPSFYLEDAEISLMKVLTPWIQEFAKQTEVDNPPNADKKQVVLDNLYFYFRLFLQKCSKKL